jgi:hypothetical protein
MPSHRIYPRLQFPAFYAEKGVLTFDLSRRSEEKRQSQVCGRRKPGGGNAPNSVADHAKVVLIADSFDEIIDKLCDFKAETGYSVDARLNGSYLEITAHGIPPTVQGRRRVNAISILMRFLSVVELANEENGCFVRF